MTMRRRMLMAQVIEREVEEEEVARSICISRFVNFLSSWNMTFLIENFHCSGMLRTLLLPCSIFVFLYSSNPLSEYPLLPACLPPQPTLRYWQWIDLAPPPSPAQLLIQEEKRQQWWRWYRWWWSQISIERKKEIHDFFSEPRLTTHYIQWWWKWWYWWSSSSLHLLNLWWPAHTMITFATLRPAIRLISAAKEGKPKHNVRASEHIFKT